MSLKSKRELLESVRPRYLKASKLEKQKMLTSLPQPRATIGNMQSVF